MYIPTTSTNLRDRLIANEKQAKSLRHYVQNHAYRVRAELRALGVSRYGMKTLESRYLPNLIKSDEHVKGAAYGWNHGDSVMLVATDKRLFFIDKKPLMLNEDEIRYDVVAGIDYGEVGLGATVVLHTRVKDYVIHAINKRAARNFVDYIERERLSSLISGRTWP